MRETERDRETEKQTQREREREYSANSGGDLFSNIQIKFESFKVPIRPLIHTHIQIHIDKCT